MFVWSFILLFLAVIAAVFGYQKPITTLTHIAKLLFFVFLILFFISLFMHVFNTVPVQPTGIPVN